MIEKVISAVMERMSTDLSSDQTSRLTDVLSIVLNEYEISEKHTEIIVHDQSAEKVVKMFLTTKRLAGCSEETIKSYGFHLFRFALNLRKPVEEVDTNDLRYYLAMYKETRSVSNTTLENIRLCLSSFFTWMHNEGIILKNPMRRISRIRTDKIVKKPFSDEELEKLRISCHTERDLAILEFMYSTGVRVSEAVRLNRDQIDFAKGQCIVYGKGAKERVVYINSKSCLHLQQYLKERDDDNPALFVSIRKPHRRLSKEGIEAILRNLGESAGVKKVHPHRLRRTMATNALNRGMRLEEVKELLGHEKTDTTLIYCTIYQDDVRMSHRKYVV